MPASIPAEAEAPKAQLPDADPVLARILALEDRRVFDEAQLEPLAGDASPAVRQRTARALGRIRDGAALPLVRRLAADVDPSVRREAAFALGLLKGSDAREVAEGMLGDPDPSVAATAATALGWVGDAASLPRLRQMLASTAPRAVRREILLSLHRFRDPAAVQMAVDRASDPDRGLREAAVYSLGRRPVPEGRTALRRALADPSAWARGSAVRGLGVIGNPEDLPLVAQLLSDPDAQVRVNTLRAVAALAGKAEPGAPGRLSAIEGLLRAADSADPALSRTAVEALGAIPAAKSPEIAAALERALASPRGDLREEAVVALAKAAPKETRPGASSASPPIPPPASGPASPKLLGSCRSTRRAPP